MSYQSVCKKSTTTTAAPPEIKTSDVASVASSHRRSTCFPSPRSRPPSARASRSTSDASRIRTSRPRAEVRRNIFVRRVRCIERLGFERGVRLRRRRRRRRRRSVCRLRASGGGCALRVECRRDGCAMDDACASGGARTMEDDYRRWGRRARFGSGSSRARGTEGGAPSRGYRP